MAEHSECWVFVRAAVRAEAKDPSQRIVITGMGLVSCHGNDVDTYYDKLLAGESAIGEIDRFDISEFPTKFAGQIRNFDSEGYIDKKSDRRYDDCLRYTMVRTRPWSMLATRLKTCCENMGVWDVNAEVRTALFYVSPFMAYFVRRSRSVRLALLALVVG